MKKVSVKNFSVKGFSALAVVSALMVSGLALSLSFAAQSYAQGYKGLIPDEQPAASTGNDSGSSNDGYSGLIPPTPPTHNSAEEPRGYAGVIPGSTPSTAGGNGDVTQQTARSSHGGNQSYSPAQSRSIASGKDTAATGYSPAHRQPEMSYRPGFKQRPPALTADDLKTLATLAAHGIDFGKLPASFEKTIHMPPGTFQTLSHPQNRIDGMLPTEFAIKRMIDTTMSLVNNPQLSTDERHKQAQAAIDRLSRMADGMRITKNIPPSIYEKMGAPDVYVQQEQEGSAKALDRLNEALQKLSQL